MKSTEKKFWEAWGQTNALYLSWAASKGVNYYLLFVLYALDGQKSMTQKKICEYTGLTKQTVNGVIKSLTHEGYITLSPGQEDRREKQLALTESGLAYSRKLLTPLYEMENAVFHLMGNDRVQQMVDEITLFNTIFEKEMERENR